MPAWLEDMNIGEVSLVDDPCNEEAVVLIVKARGGAIGRLRQELEAEREELIEKHRQLAPTDAAGAAHIMETLMDMEAIRAALAEAQTQIEDLTKGKAAADARVTELEGQLSEAIEKGKPAPTEEEADAAFLKSLPEGARARIVAERKELADIRKARADADEKAGEDAEISKARGYLKGEDEAKQVGGLLHRIRKARTTAEDADAIEGILKSARAIDAKSPLFQTQGSGGEALLADSVTPDTADAFFKAKAEEIRKAKPTLTAEQAYAQAVDENPQAYTEFSKGRYARPAA